MKLDALGEELRILYVAMTRAKEKLILTAMTPDMEKFKAQMEQKKNFRNRKKFRGKKLHSRIFPVQDAIWILSYPAYPRWKWLSPMKCFLKM